MSEEQKDNSEATWDWFINNLAHAINLLRLYLPHMDVQQRTHNWEGSAGKRCTDDVHPYRLRGMVCREEVAELAQERCHQLIAAPTGLGLFIPRPLEESRRASSRLCG